MSYRTCTRCRVEKPETAEFFTRHSTSHGGLLGICKVCKRAEEKTRRDADPELYRRLGRESHARHKGSRNAKKRVDYAVDPEPARARAAARIAADPERKRREDRKYAADPQVREKKRQVSLAWAQSHRDLARERARQWQADHPEERRAQGHAKRARRRDAEGIHTAEDVFQLYKQQKGRCYYCNVELAGTYHVDHKTPLVRGGSNWPENICCACPPCNMAKHDMTEAEFRRSRFRIVGSR